MANPQIAADVAAFLDSREARGLAQARGADLRRISEMFVELCYERLGKAPRLIDADDARELLAELLPARLARKDPLAQHVPAVLAAFVGHLESSHVVSQAFEIRRALDAAAPDFLAAVESGRFAHQLAPAHKDPFVHGAAKLGRNDPCSCGSGRKFKKCHGKDA
jgi:hypothetical protein